MGKEKHIWETNKTKRIRISEKDLEYLKSIKGRNTTAGKLEEIIQTYIENENTKNN